MTYALGDSKLRSKITDTPLVEEDTYTPAGASTEPGKGEARPEPSKGFWRRLLGADHSSRERRS
jgi:hypothetical protein